MNFDNTKIHTILSKGGKKLSEILEELNYFVTPQNIRRLNDFLIENSDTFRLVNEIILMIGPDCVERIFENCDYKEPINYADYVHYLLHKELMSCGNSVHICLSYNAIESEFKNLEFDIIKLKYNLRTKFAYCNEHTTANDYCYTFELSGKYSRIKESKFKTS